MIITCEQCQTQFQLDDSRIPERGARVRCSRCEHAFFVKPASEAGDPVENAVDQALVADEDQQAAPDEDQQAGSDEEQQAGPTQEPDPAASLSGDANEESDWKFNDDSQDLEPDLTAAREVVDDLLGDVGDAPLQEEDDAPLQEEDDAPLQEEDDGPFGATSDWDAEVDEGLGQGLEAGLDEGLGQDLEESLDEGLGQELEAGLDEGLGQAPEESLDEGLGQELEAGLDEGLGQDLEESLDEGLGQELEAGLDEGLGQDLGAGLSEDPVEGLGENLVEGLGEDPVDGLGENLVEGLGGDPVEGLGENLAEDLREDPVEGLGEDLGDDVDDEIDSLLDSTGDNAELEESEPLALAGEEPSAALAELEPSAPLVAEEPAAPTATQVAAGELGSPENWDFFADEPDGSLSEETGIEQAPMAPLDLAPAATLERPPVDVDAEPSQKGHRLRLVAHAAGWLSVALLMLAGLHGGIVAQREGPVAVRTAQTAAGFEATGIKGRWLDNAAAGPIYVISGDLFSSGSRAAVPGAWLAVRLFDENGVLLVDEAAAAGPALSEARLREEPPRELRAEQAQGARAMAAASLVPGDVWTFQAILSDLPAAASRFDLAAIPVEAAPLVVPEMP